jgi:hypothetical protein
MAANFDAVGDYIRTPTFDMPATGSFSTWVYPNFAFNDSIRHEIFSCVKDSSNTFEIMKHLDNNFYAGWFTAGVEYRVITSASALTQNSWNHLAFTWDDTANQSTLYVNDVQQGSTTASLVTFTGATACDVGHVATAEAGDHGWRDGRIAELGIWPVVLTSSDRNSLFKRYSPPRVRTSSLYRYLPLVRNLSYEARAGGSFTVNSVDVGVHPPIISGVDITP